MSRDRDTTDLVRAWLTTAADELNDPDFGLDQIISQLPTTPQRRRGWTDRWSTRGRGVMRSDGVPGHRDGRRSGRMFGFATLLAAGAIGGAALLAGVTQQQAEPGSRTIVVAQDGSGDVVTITEGVALAVDGDTVLIRPGVYVESVLITADITLTGDGPREGVIVEAAPTQWPTDPEPDVVNWAIAFIDSTAQVSNLTVIGQEAGTAILVGSGAAPVIDGITIDLLGEWTGDHGTIVWFDGGAGSLRDSTVIGYVVIEGAGSPVIEDSDMPETCVRLDGTGTPVIRGNTIRGCPYGGLLIIREGSAQIEGNDLELASGHGVALGPDVLDATVTGNEIHGNGVGISVGSDKTVVAITDNDIHGNGTGIGLSAGGSTRVEDNQIVGNVVGVSLGGPNDPVLTGNTLCDNQTNIAVVPKGRALPSLDGNDVCPDLRTPEPTAAP